MSNLAPEDSRLTVEEFYKIQGYVAGLTKEQRVKAFEKVFTDFPISQIGFEVISATAVECFDINVYYAGGNGYVATKYNLCDNDVVEFISFAPIPKEVLISKIRQILENSTKGEAKND